MLPEDLPLISTKSTHRDDHCHTFGIIATNFAPEGNGDSGLGPSLSDERLTILLAGDSIGLLPSILVYKLLSAVLVLAEQILDGARQCRGRRIWVEWAGGYSKG